MKLSLRPATLEDAQRLLDWRNDVQTRLNSFNQDKISWVNHIQWLTSSLQNPNRKIIIVEWDGVAIGTVRFDYSPQCVELSWTVAPEQRGKGYGTQMLLLACEQIKTGKVIAKIHSGNMPSIQMAKRVGFQIMENNEDWQTWMLIKKGP